MVGAGASSPIHLWRDLVKLVELRIVERQKEDKGWAEALMRIREGSHTEEDIQLLNSRLVDNLGIQADDPSIRDLPHIFHTNADVN